MTATMAMLATMATLVTRAAMMPNSDNDASGDKGNEDTKQCR